MALVGKTARRVDIPHEPGEWMEIRRLSWAELEAASDAQTDAQIARVKAMGGDVFQLIQSVVTQEQAAAARQAAASYDRAAVLEKGIVRWSYAEDLTPDNIALLDEDTAAWAFEQILALGKPRTEEEQKNDSSPSTSR